MTTDDCVVYDLSEKVWNTVLPRQMLTRDLFAVAKFVDPARVHYVGINLTMSRPKFAEKEL